nr:MAG TPA: hypothetical protein [Caudoviricetes sp.]
MTATKKRSAMASATRLTKSRCRWLPSLPMTATDKTFVLYGLIYRRCHRCR